MDDRDGRVGRRVQPSALHLSPCFHRKDLPCQVLANVRIPPAEASIFDGDVEFVVGTPEVRCRVKGLLKWVPAATNPYVLPEHYHFLYGGPPAVPFSRFGQTSLWLAKRDDVDLGGRGCMPVENLVGDIYAGVPIPERGCLGFVFEVEVAVPEIWGRFHIDTADDPGEGRWVLSAAIDAVEQMDEVEWNRVSCRAFVRAIGGLVLDVTGRPT
jgi:hypothetical protein